MIVSQKQKAKNEGLQIWSIRIKQLQHLTYFLESLERIQKV